VACWAVERQEAPKARVMVTRQVHLVRGDMENSVFERGYGGIVSPGEVETDNRRLAVDSILCFAGRQEKRGLDEAWGQVLSGDINRGMASDWTKCEVRL
jgi:hypothetical protein